MRRVGASGRSGSEEAVQPPLTERLTDDAKDPEWLAYFIMAGDSFDVAGAIKEIEGWNQPSA